MRNSSINYPSDLELLEFFEAEPSIEDGIYCYKLRRGNTNLTFSFNIWTGEVGGVTKADDGTMFSFGFAPLEKFRLQHTPRGSSLSCTFEGGLELNLRVSSAVHISITHLGALAH